MNNQPGYSQEELINAISIVAEIKKMVGILKVVSGNVAAERQTRESKQFVMYVREISERCEKVCSQILYKHHVLLSELLRAKELLKEPPNKEEGG